MRSSVVSKQASLLENVKCLAEGSVDSIAFSVETWYVHQLEDQPQGQSGRPQGQFAREPFANLPTGHCSARP